MPAQADYDLVVVGAGPTGAALAGLVGQYGHRVLVLERDAEVYPLPRAVHMDHEIMRVLQGLGLEHRISAFAGAVEDYLFQNAAGETLLEIRGGGQLAASGYSASVMFYQPELEASLRSRLLELPTVTSRFGATLVALDTQFGVRVDGVGVDGVGVDGVGVDGVGVSGVGVEYELDGARHTAHARFLVACDGASSWVRRHLAIPVEDLGFDEPWVVVDTLVHGETGLPEHIAYQFCDPRRPTTCIPAGPGRRRWEFMLLPGETREAMQRAENVWPLLAPWGGPESLELVRIAVYRFHAVIAAHWRVGAVLLAGDAAHQTPPFMGQGLCSGLRDSANLAWKLDRVLAGRSPAHLLDSYQVERAPHVRHVVESSVGMGRIVCELDPVRAAARDRRLLAARAAGDRGPGGTRGGQVAPLVAGLLHDGDTAAGWLFPQPFVHAGARHGRLDALVPTGFRLFVDAIELLPSAERLAAVGISAIVLGDASPAGVVEDAAPSALQWMKVRGLRAALVRPDHYVFGGAGDAPGVALLVEKLEQALQADA